MGGRGIELLKHVAPTAPPDAMKEAPPGELPNVVVDSLTRESQLSGKLRSRDRLAGQAENIDAERIEQIRSPYPVGNTVDSRYLY